MLKIAVSGAMGRMGRSVIQLSTDASDAFKLVAAFEHDGHAYLGRSVNCVLDSINDASTDQTHIGSFQKPNHRAAIDVLIDFSHQAGIPTLLDYATEHSIPVVIGTTGLDTESLKAIEQAAAHIPIFYAPNMSVGINVLAELVRLGAKALGIDYDVEILEMHHRHKLDSPSGTALLLGEAVAEARDKKLEDVAGYGREKGFHAARSAQEIGFSVMRGGDVIGDHSVIFAGDGERIELTHKASSRMLFAKGALKAAQWLVDRPAQLYSMRDLLNWADPNQSS